MNVIDELKIKKVINCAGKMTYLGASILDDEVAEVMKQSSQSYVSIEELQEIASQAIASVCRTEAGFITAGASAGIVIAVAALVSRWDWKLVNQIPHPETSRNKIVIQKGHAVNFGAPLTQMIQLGGGQVVEVGTVNKTQEHEIESVLDDDVAGILFVVSHHTSQMDMLSLEKVTALSKKYKVPLILDVAAEESLTQYTQLGVDAVIYSGAKAIGGPTSGFIAGKKEMIDWCRMQTFGVGRPFKVGKENMIGLLQALMVYEDKLPKKKEREKEICSQLFQSLVEIPNLDVKIVQEQGKRNIERVRVQMNDADISIFELHDALRKGDIPIYTRSHHIQSGYIDFDPRVMVDADIVVIVNRIQDIMKGEINEIL